MSIFRKGASILRKVSMALIAPIYSLLVAGLIVLGSTSSYEFMIGDGDGEMNLCNLPPESDDPSAEFAAFTGIFVFALLLVGGVRSWRARRVRPSLACGVLLASMWAYSFFVTGKFVC